MNNKGYTAIEMLVLFIVVGIIAIFSISRVTYAFGGKSSVSLRENAFQIIESEAKKYGEKNPKIFKEGKEYYLEVSELVDAGYLLKDGEKTILGFDDLNDRKIKITKSENDKVTAVVLNRD